MRASLIAQTGESSSTLTLRGHLYIQPQTQVHSDSKEKIEWVMMCWSIYTLQYMIELNRSPFAFRDLSAQKNLQVMTLFALRCVLHRSPSRDIHRWALSSDLPEGESIFHSKEEKKATRNPRKTASTSFKQSCSKGVRLAKILICEFTNENSSSLIRAIETTNNCLLFQLHLKRFRGSCFIRHVVEI